VVATAYTRNPEHRVRTLDALAKVRELLAGLGLVTPGARRLWQWLRIWPATPPMPRPA